VAELDRRAAERRLSYSRNYTYILLRHLPSWRRLIFLLWWFLIGERGSPGLGAAAAEMCRGSREWHQQVTSAWAGKVEGVRLWLRRDRRDAGESA
jgi:hypothetical protein